MKPEGHYYTSVICMHCGNRFSVPIYCGNRFCEICNAPRLARVRNRLKFLTGRIKLTKAQRLRFLTLTISNQSDLDKMIKDLISSFRRLRQRAYWKERVAGGAYVIEVKGRPGAWHAHIHIAMQSTWVKWERLLNIWMKVSTGRGVYIELIPIGKVVNYLTKYLTKPSVPDVVAEHVSNCISGYRLFQPFGSWYALNNEYQKPKTTCRECNASAFELAYFNGLALYIQEWVVTPTDETQRKVG